MKYLRYTLAALCLTASVGCLGLWGWSVVRSDIWDGAKLAFSGVTLDVEMCNGTIATQLKPSGTSSRNWRCNSHRMSKASLTHFTRMVDRQGRFGTTLNAVYFPLWYPALIFALAGVGILRIGRFTIRSALIGTTIVAVLLGMVVML